MGYAATSTLFGFDFQANAAIVLMLENIKEMEEIRLEGDEDIDITLSDKSKILAQAKAVERPYDDFANVTTKLQEALTSLSASYNDKRKVSNVIYITNSPKPFGKAVQSDIYSATMPTVYDYDELPDDLQQIVSKVLSKLESPLDTSALTIQSLPFYGNRPEERYKHVNDAIRKFLYNIRNCRVSEEDLRRIWAIELFESGTERERAISVTKKKIMWPAIVMIIRNEDYRDFDIDVTDADELSRTYSQTINNCTEKFEFVTKVLSSYSAYKYAGGYNEKLNSFLDEKLPDFYEYFAEDCIRPELRDSLLRIIIRNILVTRWQIDDLKKAAQL